MAAMALIRLRGPLKQRAGGCSDHVVSAATVREALDALEREQPELQGWILDERGRVRRHINVFVNGEAGDEETVLGGDDRVDVLPAISGGLA
jgi:molybdopterin synthase sulfur carrier subunit